MNQLHPGSEPFRMKQKTVFISITGRVQGVGFRYFAKFRAEECRIKGWVKNTPAGNVEIEASGNSTDLDTFIDWMRTGPARAIVKTFSVTEIKPDRDFTNFSIR